MRSKWTRRFLKYFHYSNIISGFVVLNCDFTRRKVTKSFLKLFYSTLWLIFFVVNYKYASALSYEGFQTIFFSEETIASTVSIEIAVTYSMVIAIMLIQFSNIKISTEFLQKLFKLSGKSGDFHYDLFDDKIRRQMVFIATFGEVASWYIYFLNLLYAYKNGVEKMMSPNPFDNSILNVCLVVLPISVVGRFSITISFFIDFIRKLVEMLNRKIENALKLASSHGDNSSLDKQVQEIRLLYAETLEMIKLFERNYSWIIVILQCVCLIVGIDQVSNF